MDIEKWLPVVDWEGLYEVSDHGRVRSLDKIMSNPFGKGERVVKGRILKPYVAHHGYLRVCLQDKPTYRKKKYFVHRLVGFAFIPNPNNFPEINHKNEVKGDNFKINLEWCTSQYNSTYKDIAKRMGRKQMKITYQYDFDFNLINTWDSVKDAANAVDGGISNVARVCRGESKTAHGFIWSYTELKKPLP